IIPAVYTMSIGEIKQFHLKGTWSNGCEREITFDPAAVWNSDDEDTVSMRSKGGEAIAHKPGSVPHINAKYKSGTSTATVDVE
ncbi:MAG: hypothetical protein U9Q40_00570, partial [Campylobacterota bacterium]|nr:hypothetical protein [Campylobacterota bacterium]